MRRFDNSRAFLSTFKEALIAYSFDLGGVLAGFIVASQLGVFTSYPWAIAVYPAILSARGMISGLFSGRLGTALHVGSIYPKLFGNTQRFYTLFESIIVVTLETSVAMSLFSMLFGILFWGLTLADLVSTVLVIVATMSLGLVLSLFTVALAFTTFKKGLDPDVIEYPIMSTVADIYITVCYVFMLTVHSFSILVPLLLVVVHVVLAIFVLSRNLHEKDFVKTIKESVITLIFVAFIVNITGTILKNINLGNSKEVYTVYPALIDTVGDVGSVVGSTATTRIALGSLEPSFSSMKRHSTHIFGAWAASAVMFILFSVFSLLINGTLTVARFLGFTTVLLVTNVMAVAAIVFVSFAVSILTFKRGLDPDNFVIPIESSLADSITSIALLVTLSLAVL
ncbi:MAG TPA: magnesium transporter [Patescibacteria group bacterium]|nr:magnesium transporter [Patescibacteria group bacterium]